ncbi:carboxypeptidase-like regulatory domain-containing protein [Microvirga sp. STR05]|uniref:Carboxypeptidase-like regulatory domain-containing protein n=1 Tax=Hymenobacter duratus TaxID=2771356 RepID=A0ABR8JDL6_9BACT|nr:carboxypeptidase-like regulatory domain-containing protein [Hymenobacter duratus]MBD2714937.1 carboxypeptidase-like regulatory domain-containing protein [Hymenobacter duratus]MBR7949843.1 carboxypeptidase-like regulatory domain-containing protein [Microvirga sp. STR05]
MILRSFFSLALSLRRLSRPVGLLTAALLLVQVAQAQIQLRGTVIDKDTRETLPFSSVVVRNTTLGTTTNVDGEFTLNVPKLPVTLLVSELGHLKDTIRVTSASEPLKLPLATAAVALPEVKVGSYPFQLVDRAYRQMQAHYDQKFYGKAFYRQLTRIDKQPTELQEVVWNVKSSNARIEGTAIAQGRYAAVPSMTNFSNFSLYTKSYGLYDANADTTKSLALLSPNVVKNYLLELKGIVSGADSTKGGIAEIDFETRPELTKYRSEGTIWIDIDSYKVVRYHMKSPNFTGSTSNPNQKFRNTQLEIEMAFRNDDPAVAVAPLEYMKVNLAADLVSGKQATPLTVSSFTFFYDTTTKPTTIPYARVSVQDRDLAAIKAIKYDPEFWANNPVVQRTPVEDEVIASFEKKGAFGTMVKKPEPKADVRIRNGRIE